MKKMYAVLWLLLFASVALQAESASPATAAATQITLGQAAVALNGPWKFHTGSTGCGKTRIEFSLAVLFSRWGFACVGAVHAEMRWTGSLLLM